MVQIPPSPPKRVIGRLGSKDRVDLDWRTRVLDTRLHVSFLARQKNRSGRVLRVYDSAEGLSGGQRQKLVIFCLAAALRYQLTEEEDDVPRFGSIVLDEAFDKADSRYTRNAMDVFRAFGFHMILATPQKLLQALDGSRILTTTIQLVSFGSGSIRSADSWRPLCWSSTAGNGLVIHAMKARPQMLDLLP